MGSSPYHSTPVLFLRTVRQGRPFLLHVKFFLCGGGEAKALEPWPCQSPSSEELKVSSLRDELVQEVGRVGPWGKDTVGTERPSRGWAGASGSHGCRLSSLWPGWLLPGLCLGGEVA